MANTLDTSNLKNQLTHNQIIDLGSNVYQIVGADSTETIEVLEVDLNTKEMKIRHCHNVYDIHFRNGLDQVLKSMGIKRAVETINTDVKAPMPGKVLEVIAKEGDTVLKGEPILILEAMKMENVLKAENDCSIKKVLIKSQESVEKNQILIELNVD